MRRDFCGDILFDIFLGILKLERRELPWRLRASNLANTSAFKMRGNFSIFSPNYEKRFSSKF